MSELVTWDRDYSGEQQFARLAVSSLTAFAARHPHDAAVQTAYRAAIAALEALAPVLQAAEGEG
jgi:hypothetical protein